MISPSVRLVVGHRLEQFLGFGGIGEPNEFDPAIQGSPLWRVVCGDRPTLTSACRQQPLRVNTALDQRRLDRVGAVKGKRLVVLRIGRGIRVANDPQTPIREVLERCRDVVEEQLPIGVDCRLLALEMEAIEIEVLLGLQRLLHRLLAIILGKVVCRPLFSLEVPRLAQRMWVMRSRRSTLPRSSNSAYTICWTGRRPVCVRSENSCGDRARSSADLLQ